MYDHSPRAHISFMSYRYLSRILLLVFIPFTFAFTLVAQIGNDTQRLELGKPIERELAGGQSHSYQIVLTSGQYVRLRVDQRGIDVVVTLFDPSGVSIVEVDSPNGTQGPEPVLAISGTSGIYRLQVRSLEKGAPAGRYEIKIEELRTAAGQDTTRIAANRAFMQADGLNAKGTAESKQSAIKRYEEARALYRLVGDLTEEAAALNSLGVVYDDLGEKPKALEYYDQALLLRRALSDRNAEAETLGNIAATYHDLSENQKALQYYSQALQILEAATDKSGQAVMLNNIGLFYSDLGETQKAVEYYLKALPVLHVTREKRAEAATLGNISLIYNARGEKLKALDYLKQALKVQQAIGDTNGEGTSLNNIGLIYRDLKKPRRALTYFKLTLPLRRTVGNRSGEARTLNNIGLVYRDLGDSKEAVEYYNQALPLYRMVNDSGAEAVTLNNLMFAWNALKNPRYAVTFGKQSVGAFQLLRSKNKGLDTSTQQGYLRSIGGVYRNLPHILIKQNRLAEAQQVLNLFKDQQYFDFDSAKQLPAPTLTPRESTFISAFNEKLEEIVVLTREFDELKRNIEEQKPSQDDADRITRLESRLKHETSSYLEFLKSAAVEFAAPSTERDEIPDLTDLQTMQIALKELSMSTGRKAVALYTLLGIEESETLLITGDEIVAASYPIKGAELNRKARQLWGLLHSPDYDPRTLSNELYRAIFKPIENKLPPDTKTIIWSLDGNLRYLPMAALYDGQQYLIERFDHVVFTRIDRERLTRPVSLTWTGHGFATSAPHKIQIEGKLIEFAQLDFAMEEMKIFRTDAYPDGIVDGDIFPESQFTKASLLATLQQKRPLVHISSHFRFSPGDESLSFLVLGDGTMMTLSEMRKLGSLFQGVELLTLSACDTAAQRADATGREIDGFAELAQRLGAGSVLASLWSVSERSTAELMKVFYTNRQGGRYTKAEALRQAQLDLLYGRKKIGPDLKATSPTIAATKGSTSADEEPVVDMEFRIPFKVAKDRPFAHPYYWAPFVLFGNWK